MVVLSEWQKRWGVGDVAMADLRRLLGVEHDMPKADPGASESAVQSRVRLGASAAGMRMWRNNSGVLTDKRGVPVRFGLGNESAKTIASYATPDLVGWRAVRITPDMVGHTIAQLVLLECKKGDWRYTGKDNEPQQAKFLALALLDGAVAMFINDESQLTRVSLPLHNSHTN